MHRRVVVAVENGKALRQLITLMQSDVGKASSWRSNFINEFDLIEQG